MGIDRIPKKEFRYNSITLPKIDHSHNKVFENEKMSMINIKGQHENNIMIKDSQI